MSTKVKHKKPFLSISFRVFLTIFAATLVIGYVSIFINPAKFWIPGIFGLYFIPLVMVNIFLMLLAIIKRSSSFWIPFLALLPALFFAEHFIQYGKEPAPLKDQEIKLLTYNVGRFYSGKDNMSSGSSKKEITAFISSNRPDIVCLQEFSTKDTSSISKEYPQYPYRQYHFFHIKRTGLFFGNLTLSKFPIISGGKITFRSSTNLALYSDIRYHKNTVRIYNCHLESNNISLTTLIKKIGTNRKELTNELSEVHNKLIGSTHRRAEQVDIVLRHIRASDYLPVICGDFNDTPVSFTFHQLQEGRKDTFKEAGNGFAATYSTCWPLLRIDYILVPDSFDVLEHDTERIHCSDHFPVITRLKFNTDYDSGN